MPEIPPSFNNKNSELTDLPEKSIEELCRPPNFQKYASEQQDKKRRSHFKPFVNKKMAFFFLCILISFIAVPMAFSFQKKIYLPHHMTYLKGTCPDFVGRKKYLDFLSKELLQSQKLHEFNSSTKIKVLWGKGGYGKSELAITFANRFFSNFSLIWTFYCDTQEHTNQGYRDLAERLGIDPKEPIEKIKKKVHFHLENQSRKLPWLLIFDNVEQEFTDYPQRGGVMLITSQKKVFHPDFHIEVQPFPQEESIELLEKITHEKCAASMESLVHDLEGIPLLINYAAHYINATPGCSVSNYQKLFSSLLLEKEGPLWKEADVNRRYLKSLAASWQFPLQALEKENPLALEWLYVCSYLYPERIREQWIDDWLVEKIPSYEKSLLRERKEILKALQTYGIIRYEEKTKTLSLHRFFQHLIRESRKNQREEDLSKAILVLGKHAKDFKFSAIDSWKEGELWYSHACEARKWLNFYQPRFQDQATQTRSALFYEGIGDYCFVYDRYTENLEANDQALYFRKSAQGENSPEVARVYQNIGWTLLKVPRYAEALAACSKAEEIQSHFLEEKPLDYAHTLTTKGKILYSLGDYEKALKCHEQAYGIRWKNLGDVHFEVGRSLFYMAKCLHRMGRYEEAIDLCSKVEKTYQKTCGVNHPFYAWNLEIKARANRDFGRWKEALKLFEKSIPILHSTFGPTHSDLTHSWDGIGWCYYYLQDFKQAKKNFEKALTIGTSHFGENHPIGIRSYRGIGWSYLKEGNPEKGLGYLKVWLHNCSQIYQNTPKMTLLLEDFRRALKEALTQGGSVEQIEQAAALGFKISSQELGADHPLTLSFQEKPLRGVF